MTSRPGSPARAFYSSPQWRKVRQLVRERDGLRCALCGEWCDGAPRTARAPEVDHIIPMLVCPELSLCPSNLRVVHKSCNGSRKGRLGFNHAEYATRRW